MGNCIIKLTRGRKFRYLEWSTVVDAPASTGMTLPELKKYIKWRYGSEGVLELPNRLKRLEKNGGFSMVARKGESLSDFILGNRAGINESELSLDEMWDMYVDGVEVNGRYYIEEE